MAAWLWLGHAAEADQTFAVPVSGLHRQLDDPALRLQASQAALSGLLGTEDWLAAAALAADADTLELSPPARPGDGITVRVRDETRVRTLAEAARMLPESYRAPRISVEPVTPYDRAFADQITEGLKRLGFDAVFHDSAREGRSSAADWAVRGSMDPSVARRALEDHPDFRVLVESTEESGTESSWDIRLFKSLFKLKFRAEHHAQPLQTAVQDWMAEPRRSRNERKAREDAVAIAGESGTAALGAALAREWLEITAGTRPTLIEIVGGASAPPAGPVEMLQNDPGVRQVLRVPPQDTRRAEAFGQPLLIRPGFALVLTHAQPWWSGWPFITAAGSVACFVALAVVAWRSGRTRASGASAPGS